MPFTKLKYYLLLAGLILVINQSHSQDVLKVENGASLNIKNGASLFIVGSIKLSNSSNLNNSGTITVYKSDSLTANFIDSNTTFYNYGIGKFVFSGNGIQTVSSLNQFEQLEVDNSINLASDLRANSWHLNSGKVNTGAFKAIATSATSLSVTADPVTNTNFANSWINGNLQRSITPAAVNSYQFPVGDATKVNLLEMDNLIADPITGVSTVTASFGPKPGNDAGLNLSENGMTYSSVNNGGVWYLIPNTNPVSGKYDLKLYFNGFAGLIDNGFGILRRPDASSSGSEWQVPLGSVLPSSGSPGRMVADGYARRDNLSSFSQLGIGMSFQPLPLTLLNFSAFKKDKAVLLQWNTTNEINISHFEIYRGLQPSALLYLNKVLSNGTTGNGNYNYTDIKPLQGISYYQLKMVDKNTSFTLSPFAKISFDNNSMLSIYPNPVTGNNMLVDYNVIKTIKQVTLIAADGKQIICSYTKQSGNQVRILLPATIGKAAYTLQLQTNAGEILNTKILIQ